MKAFEIKNNGGVDLTRVSVVSERIVLRSIAEKYAHEIFEAFTPAIARYMYPKPTEKIDEALAFIRQALEGMRKQQDLILAIIGKENDEFLGCVGVHAKDSWNTPELGVWVKKEAHGNGYGREAVFALTSWIVDNLVFNYVVYPVDRANFASRRIPEALGGQVFQEKTVQSLGGFMLDEVVYKIPRDELVKRLYD